MDLTDLRTHSRMHMDFSWTSRFCFQARASDEAVRDDTVTWHIRLAHAFARTNTAFECQLARKRAQCQHLLCSKGTLRQFPDLTTPRYKPRK